MIHKTATYLPVDLVINRGLWLRKCTTPGQAFGGQESAVGARLLGFYPSKADPLRARPAQPFLIAARVVVARIDSHALK